LAQGGDGLAEEISAGHCRAGIWEGHLGIALGLARGGHCVRCEGPWAFPREWPRAEIWEVVWFGRGLGVTAIEHSLLRILHGIELSCHGSVRIELGEAFGVSLGLDPGGKFGRVIWAFPIGRVIWDCIALLCFGFALCPIELDVNCAGLPLCWMALIWHSAFVLDGFALALCWNAMCFTDIRLIPTDIAKSFTFAISESFQYRLSAKEGDIHIWERACPFEVC
jgi:hypothetical protein